MRTQQNEPTKIEQLVEKTMICIVDRSGSMAGEKDKAATKFVKDSFILAQNQGFKTFMIVEFRSDCGNTTTVDFTKETKLVWNVLPSADGTPLYRVLTRELNKKFTGKVLVNVISDGEDTSGGLREAQNAIMKFIKEGQTITFICTEHDAKHFTKIGIPESNIQTYDNTGEGLSNSFEKYQESVENYSKSVSKGLDVTLGFYKSVKND